MDETGNLEPSSGLTTIPDQNATAPVTGVEDNLTPLPLTPEQLVEWWGRIDDSLAQKKQLEEKWDILMKEYLPVVTQGSEDIKAGLHFRNVHTKIPKLFARVPKLILSAQEPLHDQIGVDPATMMPITAEDSAPMFTAVLDKKLGRKGVKAKRLVGECLFDVLAWAGIGVTKLGYRNVKKTIQEPRMVPDPNFVPPPQPPSSPLGLAPQPQAPMVQATDPATGDPQFDPVDVIIFEEWYWTRFSPKKFLLPADLHSCRFDEEASWEAMEFFLPEHIARSSFKIPPEVSLSTTSQEDDRVYRHANAAASVRPKNLVHGFELWYKASVFDPTEPHPQKMRQLVLIDGNRDRAFVHRPSPDQTFDEQGKLTPDSMVGFPFQVFTNRDVADFPYPFADSAFSNSSIKHINTHRRQSVKLRDANIGKFLYDTGAFTPDDIERFKKGEVGEWIGVEEGKLASGQDKIVVALVKSEASRDDWRTAQTLKQDVDEMLGIGGVNAGSTNETIRTATEISTSAAALADRMEDEQGRILDCFLEGVEKFASLIQRYADDEDYIEWTGQNGARRVGKWNRKMIAFRWAFDAKPDSQLRVDKVRDRAQKLEFMKETAPFAAMVNLKPLLKSIAVDFGLDPNEFILPDVPPGLPPGPSAPGGPSPTGALPNAPAPGAGTEQMVRAAEVRR